jgi:transposase
MNRAPYPTDLTDAQWEIVRAAMPPTRGGRPRTYPLREIWNAIFYQAKNGGTWRSLPHDFPPWPAVWQQYRRWRDNGTLDAVHEALRLAVRQHAGRSAHPSAAILDSQSVRVAEKRGVAGATTPARRSPGASGTSSRTRSD